MKPSKYTVLLIPDNESEGKSFSFRRSWLLLSVFTIISIFTIILFAGYLLIPKSIEYQKMKEDYNTLAAERLKVMELSHDLQRLLQMDELLRKNLGSDNDLYSFTDDLDSISGVSSINNISSEY